MTTVVLPPLHPAQLAVWESPARFRVVVAGRRFGKTLLALVGVLGCAVRGGRCMWVAPTYQVSEVAWAAAKRLLGQLPGIVFRESTRSFELPGGGVVSFRSGERGDNLRGDSLDFLVCDEAAFLDGELWDSVLRPMLADRQGRALFISTPNRERDWFHELFLRARANAAGWEAFHYPTSANPHILPSEIDAARDTMSSLAFQREFLAEFVSAAGARVRREWLRIEQPPSDLVIAQGVDLAVSERSTADWTAVVTLGRSRDGVAFVLDAERIRAPFHGVVEFIQRNAAKWHPSTIAVEDVQAQRGVITELQRTTSLPVRGVRPDGDKLSRFAASVEARIETGIVRFARELPPWFLDELLAFPAAKHDDGVDAMVHAWNALADATSWCGVANEFDVFARMMPGARAVAHTPSLSSSTAARPRDALSVRDVLAEFGSTNKGDGR